MCQVWLLGASLGWLHLILQARGLSDPPGLTLLLIPQTSTFSPLLCLFPLSVTPLPWFFLILQVSVQSQLLGRSSSTNCASRLPTSFPILCLSCVCLSQPFNYWNHFQASRLTLTSQMRCKCCGISEPRSQQPLRFPFSLSGNPETAMWGTQCGLLENERPSGERCPAVPSLPSSKSSRKMAWPTHTIVKNNCCCFKPLRFRMIYYAATDEWNTYQTEHLVRGYLRAASAII